jgi:hypothetical protein
LKQPSLVRAVGGEKGEVSTWRFWGWGHRTKQLWLLSGLIPFCSVVELLSVYNGTSWETQICQTDNK